MTNGEYTHPVTGKVYIGTKAVAELIGTTQANIWQMASRGKLRAFRFGGTAKLWFPKEEILDLLEPQAIETKKRPPVSVSDSPMSATRRARRASARVAAWVGRSN